MMDDEIRAIWSAIPEHDRAPGVHILTGPIYVEGALPGDMLEVRYLEMVPRCDYGSNLAAHWGHLFTDFEKERHVHQMANQTAILPPELWSTGRCVP